MERSRCLGFWLSLESACRVVPRGVVFDEGPEQKEKRGGVCVVGRRLYLQVGILILCCTGINKEAQSQAQSRKRNPCFLVLLFYRFFLIFLLAHISLDPDFFSPLALLPAWKRVKSALHFIGLRNLSASVLGKPFGRQLEKNRGIKRESVIRQAGSKRGRVRQASNLRQKSKGWLSPAQHMAKDTSRPG